MVEEASPARAASSTKFGRRAVLNSVLLNTVGGIFQYASGMAVSIAIARSLGPSDYGHYAYVVWLSGIMVIVCGSGFNNTAMRFIAEYDGRQAAAMSSQVHRFLRRWLLVASTAAAGILVAVWPWARPKGAEALSVLLLVVTAVAFSTRTLSLLEVSAAKGLGRFWVEAVSIVILSVVNLGVVLALWANAAALASFLLLFASMSVANLLLVVAFVRVGGEAAPDDLAAGELSRIWRHLRWSILLAGVSAFASRSFEVLLLNRTVGPKEVAYFTIAAALMRSGVDLAVGGMSSVLMPAMSHGFGAGGAERVRAIFVEATRYYEFVGLLLAGIGYFWGGPAVLLMYGERYRPVVLTLQVMVVGHCLTLALAAYVPLLSATEKQNLRVWFTTLSVGLSGVLAFVFVPWLGLHGALISLTASNWLLAAAMVVLVKRFLGYELPLRMIARQFAAWVPAFGSGLLVYAAFPSIGGWIAGGALFILLYLTGSLFTSAWKASELMLAAATLQKVPGMVPVARFVSRRASRVGDFPAGR